MIEPPIDQRYEDAAERQALQAEIERLRDVLAECHEYIDADSSEPPPLLAKIRDVLGVGDRPADQPSYVCDHGNCYQTVSKDGTRRWSCEQADSAPEVYYCTEAGMKKASDSTSAWPGPYGLCPDGTPHLPKDSVCIKCGHTLALQRDGTCAVCAK